MGPKEESRPIFNFTEHPIIEILIFLISFIILLGSVFNFVNAYPYSWDYFFSEAENNEGLSLLIMIICSILVLLTGLKSIFKRTWIWD